MHTTYHRSAGLSGLLATVLIAAILVGCGGGSDEPECEKGDTVCRCVVNGTSGSCK